MTKYKGAKWAQILTLMAAIAASIVSGVAEAKAYAEGLTQALSAGDIAFSNAAFNQNTDNVAKALIELATKATSDAVSFEELDSPNTGKLKTYRFTKGTGANAQIMDIDIEKDQVRAIVGFVTITEGTGDDAGKYFDGATEVTSADGVTGAGVYLKSQELKDGTATGVYKYASAEAVIEYLTVGNQTGKMVTLTIDPATHTITADIADGTLTKAKLVQSLQDEIDGAAQIIEVNNIKALTNAQCEALRAGDIVVKVDGTGKHAYRVSFKNATGMCLTYADRENVETVAYDKANDDWAWTSTDVTSIASVLHESDFEWATDSEVNTAWAAALAAAATPASPGNGEGE